MAIKDIIVFFVESAIMLIPAITNAILALARGDIAGVAKAMEFGLAKLISLVIGLFARLIGLNGLSKRVGKIFKKIRKRIDKAISKLLRKARKAARKLFRKKKKNKKGKEERSKKEMEQDLNRGIKEGTKYVKSAEGKDKKEIDKKLKQIANKYELKKLNLVIDKQNENGKEQVHLDAKVNPEKKSDIFKVELDGEDGDSITRPPAGRAYLVKQNIKGDPHYVAFFPNGDLIHLGYNSNVKIKVPGVKEKLPVIEVKPKYDYTSIKAVGAVSVPAPGANADGFAKGIEKRILQKVQKYRGQGYLETKNDCLVFTLDVLNNIFDSGIRVPKGEGKGKNREKAEDYDVWYSKFKPKK